MHAESTATSIATVTTALTSSIAVAVCGGVSTMGTVAGTTEVNASVERLAVGAALVAAVGSTTAEVADASCFKLVTAGVMSTRESLIGP